MILSSYQKVRIPPRLRRKNLSRNEKLNDTTNKNGFCRRLADTRDLKSLSGDRVRVRPSSAACESSELLVDSNDVWIFFFVPFSGSFGKVRGIILAWIIPCGGAHKSLSIPDYNEILLYQTDCPQSSSHQIALLWGQFYVLRGMGGVLSSVRPRI